MVRRIGLTDWIARPILILLAVGNCLAIAGADEIVGITKTD